MTTTPESIKSTIVFTLKSLGVDTRSYWSIGYESLSDSSASITSGSYRLTSTSHSAAGKVIIAPPAIRTSHIAWGTYFAYSVFNPIIADLFRLNAYPAHASAASVARSSHTGTDTRRFNDGGSVLGPLFSRLLVLNDAASDQPGRGGHGGVHGTCGRVPGRVDDPSWALHISSRVGE